MKIEIPDFINKAFEILKKNGHEAFLVGGCVRDELMSKKPFDYDITTDALPCQMKEYFNGYRIIETGAVHGTIIVIIDSKKIEITTYRVDGEYRDNRHPSHVSYTKKLEKDLARRDFTINAMAYNDITGLVDLYDGRKHIDKKIIVCVGEPDKRFNEDGLRILRALRFAAVLGFSIEDKTVKSIYKNKSLLKNITAERIFDEFSKLICGKAAADVISEYFDIIGEFIPEIYPMVNFKQNNKYHCYDVFTHSLEVIRNTEPIKNLRLAALMHDIGKPHCYTEDENGAGHFYGHPKISSLIAREILRRLKVDNFTSKTVEKLVLEHDKKFGESEKSFKKFLTGCTPDYAYLLMKLKKADIMGKDKKCLYCLKRIEKYEKIIDRINEKNECITIKQLCINGNDLKSIGIPEGKLIGEILQKLLFTVIDKNIINEKQQLLGEAKKFIKKNNKKIMD